MDVAHCLRLADKTALESLVDDFERRFPQVFLSLFLGVLPSDMNVAEAGFWMLNHGIRKRQDRVCDNRYGILLLIDPASHLTGVSLGYSLEPLLPRNRLSTLLQNASHHLWHSNYATGIKAVVAGMDDMLRKAGKPQRRSLSGVIAGSAAALGLKKWRSPAPKTDNPATRELSGI